MDQADWGESKAGHGIKLGKEGNEMMTWVKDRVKVKVIGSVGWKY